MNLLIDTVMVVACVLHRDHKHTAVISNYHNHRQQYIAPSRMHTVRYLVRCISSSMVGKYMLTTNHL
jgi:hypothetical protein